MTRRERHRANDICEFGQDVGYGVVGNGMDGIQTQTVEAIFIQPVECIMNEKIPDIRLSAPSKLIPSPHGV